MTVDFHLACEYQRDFIFIQYQLRRNQEVHCKMKSSEDPAILIFQHPVIESGLPTATAARRLLINNGNR